jgi:uncharacterized damage-inducible protein DinB
MKDDLFGLLAMYNRTTNEDLTAILARLPEETLRRDLRTFYKSLLGVVAHVISADINWLKRFRAAFPRYAMLSDGLLDRFDDGALKGLAERPAAELFALRREADALIERFAAELEPEDLRGQFDFRNWKGESQRKTFWHALLHMFNHETHHRGQAADLLDQLGVDNDFSNLIRRV